MDTHALPHLELAIWKDSDLIPHYSQSGVNTGFQNMVFIDVLLFDKCPTQSRLWGSPLTPFTQVTSRIHVTFKGGGEANHSLWVPAVFRRWDEQGCGPSWISVTPCTSAQPRGACLIACTLRLARELRKSIWGHSFAGTVPTASHRHVHPPCISRFCACTRIHCFLCFPKSHHHFPLHRWENLCFGNSIISRRTANWRVSCRT